MQNLPEIMQEELCINNINEKMNTHEEKKEIKEEEENSIIDIEKIKEVYHKSKMLILELTSNNSNSNNNDNTIKKIIIEIDPLGYSNSKRKKDGLTYFGYAQKGQENGLDIILEPIDNEITDNKYFGKHFQIKFNPEDLNYYLKDLGHGFGTFIKILDWIEIKNNYLLNIGDNYLVFSIGLENGNAINENYIIKNNNIENGSILNVKIFSSNSEIKSLVFTPSDSPFTIGRKSENAIFIEDNMLSRIHSTIKYKNKNKKWYIRDGYIINNNNNEEVKKSTNGTWIYAFEDTIIKNKMTFKASHYLFDCNLYCIQNYDTNIRKE